MTTKKLSAWLGLAIAGMLCGCGASLQGAEVATPKSCLVASRSTGSACPAPPSEKLAARTAKGSPATGIAAANFDLVPYAWASSRHPSR